jgi:delta 1-pyrroline-5-carboxylate dehydrogenase
MACYGNVSSNSEDIWKSGLELHSEEQTTLSSGSNSDANNQYQVYAIIDDTLEEVDANNNPIINPGNVRRGVNHMAEADTEETIAARVKVQLTPEEWDTIRAVVNNGAAIPIDARREVLLGYHYALHRQAQQLQKEKKAKPIKESRLIFLISQ